MATTYTLDDVRGMAAGAPQIFTLDQVHAMQSDAFKQRMLARETNDLSSGLRRGARDVIDTGAEGLAWLFDKATGADMATGEHARVKSLNQAAKEEWRQGTGGELLPQLQRFVGNILATTPVTAAAGAGVRAAGLPSLGNAIGSAGMSTGRTLPPAMDMLTRMAGGGINGAMTAGLVEPDSAGLGAVVGAALPPVLKGAGVAADVVGKGFRAVRPSAGVPAADLRAARDIAEAAGIDPNNPQAVAAIRDALRQQGPRVMPGQPSVAEILQTPGISQLQRSVEALRPDAFVNRAGLREAARREVLERIAPIGKPRDVAESVGTNVAEYAIPAHRAAGQRVNALFDSIDPNQAMLELPLQRMQNAQTRFLGPGSFGKGSAGVEQAMQTATHIGMDQRTLTPRVVPFNQIQALRSSIGEAITDAQSHGRNQAAAALTEMKNAIDDKVAQVASGQINPGEVFTPQAVDAWERALAAHGQKKAQFATGPQAAMFRNGADGLPVIQGGEIPRRFFNATASQVSDAQAFRRLVQNDPRLMNDLRRYAVSDAADQVDRFGNLTSAKFNKWLESRSGAVGETFTTQQRAWLHEIAQDLRRSDVAESLGRSTGSDTAQKIASMTRLGLLDSPATRAVSGRIPFGTTLLDQLSVPLRNAKADRYAQLLLDPEKTGGLLDAFIATNSAPVTRGLLASSFDPLLFYSAPALSAQQQR